MLEWHDCRTDSPSEQGYYILAYHSIYGLSWERAYWSQKFQRWMGFFDIHPEKDCYKWAEIELPE